MKIIFILISLIVILLSSCTVQLSPAEPTPEILIKCCQECGDAFSRSPVGVPAEGAICGRFTTAEQMSNECINYFTNNSISVAQCEVYNPIVCGDCDGPPTN